VLADGGKKTPGRNGKPFTRKGRTAFAATERTKNGAYLLVLPTKVDLLFRLG